MSKALARFCGRVFTPNRVFWAGCFHQEVVQGFRSLRSPKRNNSSYCILFGSGLTDSVGRVLMLFRIKVASFAY